MVTSSKRTYATPGYAAPRAHATATDDPYLHRTHSNTQRQVWLSLCGVSWCAHFCLSLPSVSDGYGFDSKCDFTPSIILLGLLLCTWMWNIFFWWDPEFSCRWLFNEKTLVSGGKKGSRLLWENRLLEGTNKMCAPGPRRKKQWPHKRLTQSCLWVPRSLWWRCG